MDGPLRTAEWVVFDAGTHEHSVRIKSTDLVSIAGARIADICED